MNKAQVLALMMRRNHQSTQTDLLSISELMAEMLSEISDRLSEDEFYRFISIGSAVYSHGLKQFGEDVEADASDLDDDDWPSSGDRRMPGGRH